MKKPPAVITSIIQEISQSRPKTPADLLRLKKEVAGKYKLPPPSSATLLRAYEALCKEERRAPDTALTSLLKRKLVRTNSGIAPVTVLTKPYPCPGKCVYCPLERDMPKSYLKSEPAAARAFKLKFDPYTQVVERIAALRAIGHDAAKIELIVKGGTWSSYPTPYREWFIKRCFDGANAAGRRKTRAARTLLSAQTRNERATHRIIGLTLETRPDRVTPKEVEHLRKLGCTRIELGLQHTDDDVLALVKRGHTAAHAKKALALLRDAGFKTDLHMMPQLPGSSPARDRAMFDTLFADPEFRPDMVKIYPCVVTPGSELFDWHANGAYVPYSDAELFETLIAIKTGIPRYCRISRLIRDIPSTDIIAGNKVTNLRESLQREMKKRGLRCNCLRCREVAHAGQASDATPELFDDIYEASHGTEHFVSFEDKNRSVVFAFCRLRLPNPERQAKEILERMPEIRGAAFIRELHTYGAQVALNTREEDATQHKGLGKKLVAEAERIAREAGFKKLAIISGIGVRAYYRKLGYRREGTYMVKRLK